MSVKSRHAPMRTAMANRPLGRILVAYAAANVAEWALWVSVLVYSFERGGSDTAGFAAIALLVPAAAIAPFAGRAADGPRPEHVLFTAHLVQAAALLAAALLAASEAPSAAVIVAAAFAITAVTFVRPSISVVVPGLVVAPRDLIAANLILGNVDSVSVLAGPLVASALLSIDGTVSVFAACAVLWALAAALVHIPASRRPSHSDLDHDNIATDRGSRISDVLCALRELSRRRGSVPLLVVLGAQYALIGALDLLVVNLALRELHLGAAGPGLLSASFGVGAVGGGIASTLIVGRRRLAWVMTVALAMIAAALAVLGIWTTLAVALSVLPLAGVSRSLLDVSGRMLLQRCAPPDSVASVFAILEALAGLGILCGSVMVQVLVAGSGVRAAIIGVAIFFVVVGASTARSLRHADQHADAPVVEIRLLRKVELLAPLPGPVLESLARESISIELDAGAVIVREGEVGDRYYVIAAGMADVFVEGVRVRTMSRGQGFGEIALLADVARTATVVATTPISLLALERLRFLESVTGHDASARVAWAVARTWYPPLVSTD
ncbi:MAG: cyclic nucleotide-binding domain-containing protein [Ilumatobacteraceae bacterium]